MQYLFGEASFPGEVSTMPVAVLAPAARRPWWYWGLVAAECSALSLGAFYLYQRMNRHYAHVGVMETISLPPGTSDSVVEVSIPLSGEVRLSCNMLSHSKFLLKSNTQLLSSQGPSKPVDLRRKGVVLSDVMLSDMCDTQMSFEQGSLYFSPPCVSNGSLLMTYKGITHESFQPPVAVKQCWVQPASTPGAHRLTFTILAYNNVQDVSATIVFPKGSHILSVNTGGRGRWSAAGPNVANEIIWTIDALTPGDTTHSIKDQLATLHGASMTRAVDDGPSAVEEAAQEQLLVLADQKAERAMFDVVFSIDPQAAVEDLNKARVAQATNRKERRRQERAQRKKRSASPQARGASDQEYDFADEGATHHVVSFDPSVHAPGVCIAYSTHTASSGLSVRRMTALNEEWNFRWWEAVTRSEGPQTLKQRIIQRVCTTVNALVDGVQGLLSKKVDEGGDDMKPSRSSRGLSKKIRYTSHFFQQVPVTPNY